MVSVETYFCILEHRTEESPVPTMEFNYRVQDYVPELRGGQSVVCPRLRVCPRLVRVGQPGCCMSQAMS